MTKPTKDKLAGLLELVWDMAFIAFFGCLLVVLLVILASAFSLLDVTEKLGYGELLAAGFTVVIAVYAGITWVRRAEARAAVAQSSTPLLDAVHEHLDLVLSEFRSYSVQTASETECRLITSRFIFCTSVLHQLSELDDTYRSLSSEIETARQEIRAYKASVTGADGFPSDGYRPSALDVSRAARQCVRAKIAVTRVGARYRLEVVGS